ncbi:helix-turn-helix transcriptional regulator [Pseudoalteromonas luteoviolacea]|uniref:helix-turn-helix domain-containing protein n=1 Tax=Pseudoalteromonas luteoviolacea TaxID=43657 RepID=UPI001B385B0D|nr:helix-turn-helix transcriptional regulator [Pseudoalteromonas luteoviolacea]MBQ4814270.1 helix-turn-helix transcriptional regulator [Pseudoalteromonas luteoviolacea]
MNNTQKLTSREIIEKLKPKDICYTDIAAALEVSPGHVSRIANGEAKSRRVAQAICSALEMPLDQVFGGMYEPKNRNRDARKTQIVLALRKGSPIPPPRTIA